MWVSRAASLFLSGWLWALHLESTLALVSFGQETTAGVHLSTNRTLLPQKAAHAKKKKPIRSPSQGPPGSPSCLPFWRGFVLACGNLDISAPLFFLSTSPATSLLFSLNCVAKATSSLIVCDVVEHSILWIVLEFVYIVGVLYYYKQDSNELCVLCEYLSKINTSIWNVWAQGWMCTRAG